MRIVALLAAYNERRFIGPCLDHLSRQGIDAYLIDNCSTDDTVAIAERWLGSTLIGIESFPREKHDTYPWRSLLNRKEELSRELDGDWFIHLDPDEIRLPPSSGKTLSEALEAVASLGYNAVNFFEFTFTPTLESPDHDHPNFQRTMHSYYPFAPDLPHRLSAWKRADDVELAPSAGHKVQFSGLKMYPENFPMKHYLFLSVPHAIEKFVQRRYDQKEVKEGWHGWRARLTAADLWLPAESELRMTRSDHDLDARNPRTKHYIDGPLHDGD